MEIIAKIKTDFPKKFAIPRQSGLAPSLAGTIIFEPGYIIDEAVRGIEQYSYLWLIWDFSETKEEGWSPTVRPPRLGGNKRVGVFATRSNFRPNSIGLSSVKLLGVEKTEKYGTVLHVSGADLMDGTPIYDIKPYLPYTDSHPDAEYGFAREQLNYKLSVTIPKELSAKIKKGKEAGLYEILENDPRPSYHDDPERVYGFSFAGMDIKFRVEENRLDVLDIII